MVVVDGKGVPLGNHLGSAYAGGIQTRGNHPCNESASRTDVGRGRPRQKPQRLIGDRAYDSEPLRARLKKARHRVNRASPSWQGSQGQHKTDVPCAAIAPSIWWFDMTAS